MELIDKIAILADSAKYDVSCSSSGSSRAGKKGELGNASLPGICHSWSDDGRCISLLKILFTNHCIYNCAYCVNRASEDVPRAAFTPEELIDLTIGFYRRNYIEGLFLSSGVMVSPDHTMERLIKVVKELRLKHHFHGYIHLKTIPGASHHFIDEAGKYVDRLSVNIELPTSQSLMLLAPEKSKESILTPMAYTKDRMLENRSEGRIAKGHHKFLPAGQTTQLMIGATPDTDRTILRLSESLYRQMSLKRVYYSAYVPIVTNHPALPTDVKSPLLREHRLYQSDWLLRFYGFEAAELLDDEHANLDMGVDPKCDWALRHMDQFPIDIQTADINMLLRIPGIGPISARRIMQSRRFGVLGWDDLKKCGVVLKRAKYFLVSNGRLLIDADSKPLMDKPDAIRSLMVGMEPKKLTLDTGQLDFFELHPKLLFDPSHEAFRRMLMKQGPLGIGTRMEVTDNGLFV